MLEVFYETETKIITAWRSESRIGIRQIRDGERRILLAINPPFDEGAATRDYLYDVSTQELNLNPAFTLPEPPRDLGKEIDDLKVEVVKLKAGAK